MTRVATCLAFLRELEGRAVARLRGQALPDHVRSCASCASRLAAAESQIRLLSRVRPSIPAEVASSEFFEGVQHRVPADRQAAERPVVELLSSTLRPVTAPDHLDWPAGPLEDAARRAIGHSRRPPAIEELWDRVRRDVRQQVEERRSVTRRIRLRVAVTAAAIVVGAWFAANWGTSRAPDIVFHRLSETPATDLSPVALLRHAQGE